MSETEGLDIERLLAEEAAKRPLVEHSKEEMEHQEAIEIWYKNDFDLTEKPEVKEELLAAIDREYQSFKNANPGEIDNDRNFLTKLNKLYACYKRPMGNTSAFDYEIGYLFLLDALSNITTHNKASSGRKYLLQLLTETRPFYNNPKTLDDKEREKMVAGFTLDGDFEGAFKEVLTDLEVFANLSPSRYYKLTQPKADNWWDSEEYKNWKESLPEEFRTEEGSDIVLNNVHWVGMLLFNLYKRKNPEVDAISLNESIKADARTRLDAVYEV